MGIITRKGSRGQGKTVGNATDVQQAGSNSANDLGNWQVGGVGTEPETVDVRATQRRNVSKLMMQLTGASLLIR